MNAYIATATTTAALPTGSPTTRTSDGASYPSGYTDLDAGVQLTEIGANVKNTSGSKREMGTVTLIIDFAN